MADSSIKKLGRFGWRVPWAILWYVARGIRQGWWRAYFSTIGRYGFRRLGRGVRIDGCPSFIFPCADIRLGDGARIGKRVVFQGAPDSVIEIGKGVTINDGCVITANESIVIGDYSSIGEYTSIRDYNHAFRERARLIKEQGYTGGSIRVGRDVWIGRGCCITAGVTIGDGAVIGANSVVNKDLPPYCVAVGAPARVVSQRV